MKSIFVFSAGVIILLALAACGAQVETTPTVDAGAVMTSVAQAVQTQLAQTLTAQPTATATITPTPTFTATPTMSGTIATLALPTSIATISIPIVGGTSTGPDNAQWVADITIPDNTVIQPGTQFTKTWRIKNTGTTTWDSTYKLLYIDGISLNDVPKVLLTPSVKIPTSIAPGATVDLSVDLVTPDRNGTLKVWYRMLSPTGKFFGESVWALVIVSDGSTTIVPSATP